MQAALAGTLVFYSSCVTVAPNDGVTEKWCYYDRAGIYHCQTCSGSTCVCTVSAYDLCSFGTWERACQACYEERYSDYGDLYFDSRLDNCSPRSVCELCHEGADICGPYPRPGWYRPMPPPSHPGYHQKKGISPPSEKHRRLMDNRKAR